MLHLNYYQYMKEGQKQDQESSVQIAQDPFDEITEVYEPSFSVATAIKERVQDLISLFQAAFKQNQYFLSQRISISRQIFQTTKLKVSRISKFSQAVVQFIGKIQLRQTRIIQEGSLKQREWKDTPNELQKILCAYEDMQLKRKDKQIKILQNFKSQIKTLRSQLSAHSALFRMAVQKVNNSSKNAILVLQRARARFALMKNSIDVHMISIMLHQINHCVRELGSQSIAFISESNKFEREVSKSVQIMLNELISYHKLIADVIELSQIQKQIKDIEHPTLQTIVNFISVKLKSQSKAIIRATIGLPLQAQLTFSHLTAYLQQGFNYALTVKFTQVETHLFNKKYLVDLHQGFFKGWLPILLKISIDGWIVLSKPEVVKPLTVVSVTLVDFKQEGAELILYNKSQGIFSSKDWRLRFKDSGLAEQFVMAVLSQRD